MRTLLFIVALAPALALPAAGVAQRSGQGAGVFVGGALGVAAKRWVDADYAVAVGAGLDLVGSKAAHLHADYLVHDARLKQRLTFFRQLGGDGRFLATYGAGARLRLLGGSRLGVRLPAGLVYAAGDDPWDAFFEVAAVLDVVPENRWGATALAGARWYFDAPSAPRPTPVF